MLDRAGGGGANNAGEESGSGDEFGSQGPTARARAPALAGARGDMDDEIPF
jgi:hypothetical protein